MALSNTTREWIPETQECRRKVVCSATASYAFLLLKMQTHFSYTHTHAKNISSPITDMLITLSVLPTTIISSPSLSPSHFWRLRPFPWGLHVIPCKDIQHSTTTYNCVNILTLTVMNELTKLTHSVRWLLIGVGLRLNKKKGIGLGLGILILKSTYHSYHRETERAEWICSSHWDIYFNQ